MFHLAFEVGEAELAHILPSVEGLIPLGRHRKGPLQAGASPPAEATAGLGAVELEEVRFMWRIGLRLIAQLGMARPQTGKTLSDDSDGLTVIVLRPEVPRLGESGAICEQPLRQHHVAAQGLQDVLRMLESRYALVGLKFCQLLT